MIKVTKNALRLLASSIITLLLGCVNLPNETVRINNIEVHLVDFNTEKPLSNIRVQYYLKIKRSIGFPHRYFKHIPIIEGEIFSNDNGIVNIPENLITRRKGDTVNLIFHINMDIDKDGIISEKENYYGKKLNENDKNDNFAFYYFVLYEYRNHVISINENYYPAYTLFFHMDGKDSYTITQVNNTGNRDTDFQLKYIDNMIYRDIKDILIIKLFRKKYEKWATSHNRTVYAAPPIGG